MRVAPQTGEEIEVSENVEYKGSVHADVLLDGYFLLMII